MRKLIVITAVVLGAGTLGAQTPLQPVPFPSPDPRIDVGPRVSPRDWTAPQSQRHGRPHHRCVSVRSGMIAGAIGGLVVGSWIASSFNDGSGAPWPETKRTLITGTAVGAALGATSALTCKASQALVTKGRKSVPRAELPALQLPH
jgi:hypothetical protein